MDYILGEIVAFGFNWVPYGFVACNGQLLNIQQNSALFALLSITYGGDGRTTFGVPDLRGRVILGYNPLAIPNDGISANLMGQKTGVESTLLNVTQLPQHTHTATVTGQGSITGSATAVMNVNTTATTSDSPDNVYLGLDGNGGGIYADTKTSGKTLKNDAITVNTSGLGVSLSSVAVSVNPTLAPTAKVPVMQPSQVANFCICTMGIFPSRD